MVQPGWGQPKWKAVTNPILQIMTYCSLACRKYKLSDFGVWTDLSALKYDFLSFFCLFCYCRYSGSPAHWCIVALTRKGPKIRVCICGRYCSLYLIHALRGFMQVTVTTEETQLGMLDTCYRRLRKKMKWVNQPRIVESLFLMQFWYLLNPFPTLPVQKIFPSISQL